MTEKRHQLPDIIEENHESLAKELLSPATLEEIKKRVPDLSSKIIAGLKIAAVCHEVEGFSGPIPPPSTLKEYEAAHPGLAERIVIMAEKEQNHRHGMDKLIIESTASEKKRGQTYGFIIGTTAIFVSCWLGLTGATTVASIIGGTSVVGLVTVFVIGKKVKESSSDEKEDAIEKKNKITKKTSKRKK